jgi:hypothetical protein
LYVRSGSDNLINILGSGGVDVQFAENLRVGNKKFSGISAVVAMNQPYGVFAKALLEKQVYPDLRDTAGLPQTPYDVTAHTLPLLMGVEATPVTESLRLKDTVGIGMGSGGGCGDAHPPRRAIYKSYVPSMDEGWTRWVLDFAAPCTKYLSLEDKAARDGNLRAKYDTVIIPDHSPRAILNGHAPGTMPEEFTGGIGAAGVKALREFVEAGGTLVTLNRASRFAVEEFKLPVRDITEGLKRRISTSPARSSAPNSTPRTRSPPECRKNPSHGSKIRRCLKSATRRVQGKSASSRATRQTKTRSCQVGS